jgi:Uma2 family endonuclease
MTIHAPIERTTRVRLTVDDFLLLDRAGAFDHYGHTELIDGGVISMNSQFRPHAYAKSELAFRLNDAIRAARLDVSVLIEGSVALPPHNVPMPDIAVTNAARGEGPVPAESLLIAIEIADSTLRFDLGRKAKIYAAALVPEYWVVDLKGARIVRMTQPGAKGYTVRDEVLFGALAVSSTIQGIAVETGGLA